MDWYIESHIDDWMLIIKQHAIVNVPFAVASSNILLK